MAISGNGRLHHRIDRILSDRAQGAMTRGRMLIVASACVAAIAIAAACRPATKIVELTPDPMLTQQEADLQARGDRERTARTMTRDQVAQLEATVAGNPEDLATRETLLMYYGDPDRTLDAGEIAARRAHVLWIITHHPDHRIAGVWGVRLYTTKHDPNPDPDGYAEGKKLWLAVTQRNDPATPASVFGNAASFFETADKPLAEANWLKANAREPGKFSGALGRLYAFTLMGSDAAMPLNVLRHVSMTQAHNAFAQRVRQTLDASTDVNLLTTAGEYLIRAKRSIAIPEIIGPGAIDFDPHALGVTYLQRALAQDPNTVRAAALLYRDRVLEQNLRLQAPLRGLASGARVRAILAMPEDDRLHLLPDAIAGAYFHGENTDYFKKDRAAAKAAWEDARRLAHDALTIGPRHTTHPAVGEAMFNAHMYLGTIALWDGDVRTALQHLRAAPGVPPSEGLEYTFGITSSRLTRHLIKAGEYEAVASFYDRMAPLAVMERAGLQEAATALRAGKMPGWYQMAATREAARDAARDADRSGR